MLAQRVFAEDSAGAAAAGVVAGAEVVEPAAAFVPAVLPPVLPVAPEVPAVAGAALAPPAAESLFAAAL